MATTTTTNTSPEATQAAPTSARSTSGLSISHDTIVQCPKVLLHDHLDGGLRINTILELAEEFGYHGLPTTDPHELETWFHNGANRLDLALYLETFTHTVGVMQHYDAIVRVAKECAEDLAADGVVYAEVRMAPELCTEQGLSMDDVVRAILEGFRLGSEGTGLTIRMLATAMRTAARSVEIADLALRFRDQGVVGFDIAGKEAGFPPSRHLDAFQLVAAGDFHITIHAGEAFGLPSISEALHYCGAERLGHGVRIIDDITIDENGEAHLGTLAAYVRDRRVPLELCPLSNVHTGAAASVAEHPIGLLTKLRYRVTVNTDNRLMSNTSMSTEFGLLASELGFTLDDFQWVTVNAMKSAFIHFDERLDIINNQIKPAYAQLIAGTAG